MACEKSDLLNPSIKNQKSFNQYYFAFISLTIILLIIYSNGFHCDWHFDDDTYILYNEEIHIQDLSWNTLIKVLQSEGPGQKRPVSYLSFALNYYFGKLNPFGYHVVNFSIHLLNSLLLFVLLFRTLTLPSIRERFEDKAYHIALLSTLMWATSPVNAFGVTYICQRMASLSTFFAILCMLSYIKARSGITSKQTIIWTTISFIFFVISIFAKENTAILPFSILAYDILFFQGIKTASLKRAGWITLVIGSIVVILFLFHRDLPSIFDGYSNRPFSLTERLITEPRVLLFYISLLVYPLTSRLSLYNDIEMSHSLLDPWSTLPALLIILLSPIVLYLISKKRPLIGFCLFFFLINHMVEGTFLALEPIFLHRNYLPSLFFFVPIAIAVVKAFDYFAKERILTFLIALVVTFFIAAQGHTTFMINKIFQQKSILLKDSIIKQPKLSVCYNNLGILYLNKGYYDIAEEYFITSIRYNNWLNLSHRCLPYVHIGLCYLNQHINYDLAELYFKKSNTLSLNPRAFIGLATLEMQKGNFESAYRLINEALNTWPGKTWVLITRSRIYLLDSKIDQAIKDALIVLGQKKEDDLLALTILGEAFRRKGDFKRAIIYWEKYLKLNPRSIEGRLALIELYHKNKNGDKIRKLIGQLIVIKEDKTFEEIIKYQIEKESFIDYTPDKDVLLPIIHDTLDIL